MQREEITRQLDQLGPAQREQVLRFIHELNKDQNAARLGEPGSALRKISGILDTASAREMREAIEQDCEHVDVAQW